MGRDLQERISVRAYRIWEEKGRPHGSAEDHWHQAKREIEQEERAVTGTKAGKPGTAAKPRATRTGKAAAASTATTSTTEAVAKPAAVRKTPARSKTSSKKNG